MTFYRWCTGCRIPVHACLFTGSLSPGRGLAGECRCHESNCENENKDRDAAVVPSETLIRWIRSRKENRIMIETDGDLLQTSARIYVGLLSFA